MTSPSAPPPAPPRRSTTRIVAAVALVLVVVLVGGGLAAWATLGADSGGSDDAPLATPPKPSSTVAAPSYPSELAKFYTQKLDWKNCDSDQCTHLTVPLDYAHPHGRTIELAVLRAPATRRGERVGQLVVDPGGPGGSAVDYASSGAFTFGGPLTRYFDIVGMDPRGVGRSTPLECGDTEQVDEFVGVDPDPDTPAEVKDFDRVNREFGQRCLTRDAGLTRHMSTIEAAKDMDILRAALGERQLDYLGASYGTLLGATYADLFPHNIRRMVLDGALDPTLTNEQLNLGQSRGFETALTAYVQYCVDRGDCVLGDDVDAAKQHIRQLLDSLDSKPLPTSSGRPLTESLGRFGVVLPLYVKTLWPILSIALSQAIEDGRGDQLLALADQYTARGPEGYNSNEFTAYWAVSCLDYPDSVPGAQMPSKFKEFDDASPTFGRLFVYDLAKCADWPVKSTHKPAPIHAPGAPPIVVIGTTRDPATPYIWAKALASQLDSGRLISRDGDGHTGYHQGNQCVDDAVQHYLVGGTVPQDNLSC
ncbi:alpha/beta hydrolase [Marmoricola sp. URHB0036]|uniref:alpha/beta hydrolase n=1 Tax=Marmoricola sp. URHB0036 TaxID=1298863 RepID=UPI000685B190|nr:alpha/beta hydrolase [Marmoricola sp. URHB0036]